MPYVSPRSRRRAAVRATLITLSAAFVLALSACALPQQEPPDEATGALRVLIEGIDAPADVTVTGAGFARTVTGTTTLEGLVPGGYQVAAAPVAVAAATFTAVVSGSPAEVAAGETAEVRVSYTRNDPPVIDGPADAVVVRNTRTPRSATLTFRVADADGDAVTATAKASDVGVLPDALTPVCDAVGACELTLTPSPDATAEATVTVTADDGRGGVTDATAVLSVLPRLVTSGADDGPGSLRAVVAAADAGDVVGFAESAGGTIALASEIAIEIPLSIEGPGAEALALDGAAATRLVRVAEASTTLVVGAEAADDAAVTITDLTLTRGAAPDGGAILNSGSLLLRRVTIRDSEALSGRGGGVYNLGSVVIEAGRLAGNRAELRGGAVATEGPLRLRDTVLEDNEAGAGGGALSSGGEATLELIGGSVVGNRATAGAGLLLDASGATTVEGTSFEANVAEDEGGAMFQFDTGPLTAVDAEVRGNEAGTGGALHARGAATVRGGVYADNVAANGGAFYLEATDAASLILDGVEIAGNEARSNGGGLNVHSDLTVTGATRIVGNHAGSNGGGVYLDEGSATFGPEVVVEDNRGDDNGGGLFVFQAEAALTGTAVRGNVAGRNGGGIFNMEVLALVDVTLGGFGEGEGNRAGDDPDAAGSGGGLFHLDGQASVAGSRIFGNRAVTSGGGIRTNGPLTLTDTEVRGNEVVGVEDGQGLGGGLHADDAVSVSGGLFRNNRAAVDGGGIYTGAALTLVGVEVGGPGANDGNVAERDGGGLALADGATLDALDSGFDGNSAVGLGGGIASRSAGAVSLVGGTVEGNTAAGGNVSGNGGGVAATGGELILDGVAVRSNRAANGGGVYAVDAQVLLDGARVEENLAFEHGGGVFSVHVLTLQGGTEVRANLAGNMGGGVYLSNGTLRVSASTIGGDAPADGNQAGEFGGGIASLLNGVFIDGESLIGFNRGGIDGGGLWLVDQHVLEIELSTIADNAAEGRGGGVFYDLLEGSTATLTDVKVLNNQASDGGGFFRDGAFKIGTDGASFDGNTPNDLAP